MILKGNLLYGQSGGPTSVINSSAYYLFEEAFKHVDRIENIYAMHYGLEGLLEEDLILIKNNKELKKLINTPGSYFGSNRFKLDYQDKETFIKILNIFKKYNIRYFFYNGGNDSMDSITKLNDFFKENNYECYSIGIPKTIDNDLSYCDHTLGYPTAAKFIANSVCEIFYDDNSYKTGRVNIIEVMGRNAGWLAASSLLANLTGAHVDLIYVPESIFSIDKFLEDVKKIYSKKHHCLVVVSEGIKDKSGRFVFETNAKADAFNHVQLGGVGLILANLVNRKLNFKVRAIELSLLQRASTISLSKEDIKECKKVSKYALKLALNNKSGYMVTINRVSSSPYKIKLKYVDLHNVSNIERTLPLEYINKEKNYISSSFIDYCLPLIEGNINSFKDNGLIDFYND